MRTSPVIFEFAPERRPRRNTSGDRLITIARLFETRGRSVPMIRLRGQWLKQLGFAPGKRIAIVAERNRLVITLDDAEVRPL